MKRFLSKYILVIAMCIVCLGMVFVSDKFLVESNLQNLARRISATTVMSVGQVLVILTAGIDLSVGSVAALSQMIAGKAIKEGGLPIIPGFALGISAGATCGFINGLLITKGRIPPFIVTLGMMLAARGAALGLSDGSRISGFSDAFKWVGGGIDWWVPFVVALGVVACFAVVLNYTRFGRELYAIGGNLAGARLSGINVDRVRLGAYTLCGTLAGAGGIMIASRSGVCDPTSAEGAELDAIAACVVGGASLMGGEGGAIGALFGALIIGILVNVCQLNSIPNEIQRIIVGVLIVALVFVDNWRKRKAGKLKEF
ncbi:MAG TPA: ABC transporter permease [Candidatus Hydrogenedentes bacterium]|nr:ABC transporter permease [Candidatus Hydrogenedentota bacterium]